MGAAVASSPSTRTTDRGDLAKGPDHGNGHQATIAMIAGNGVGQAATQRPASVIVDEPFDAVPAVIDPRSAQVCELYRVRPEEPDAGRLWNSSRHHLVILVLGGRGSRSRTTLSGRLL